MYYTIIDIPKKNDSMSTISIKDKSYKIRFTYQDYGDCWKFGLYNSIEEPIAIGIKIVPGTALTIFSDVTNLPIGFFGAKSSNDRIGKDDFFNGTASFYYCSIEDQEE